ncbi:MAG: class I tRNA ligase family protein [Parcubacteria group bacterium]
MTKYEPSKIEPKWQKKWEDAKLYETPDSVKGKDNFYKLTEFSYPSGDLHMGHWYAFSVPDIFARYKRMQGYNVLYPVGFDAFGLPAENAAIKNNLQPDEWTQDNVKHITEQLRTMGAMFDWSRMVNTTDPEYYKWTQWIFIQFFNKGLAYRTKTIVNWCPSCKTVLANEQVVNGECERCGTQVEQREREQWMYKITNYAQRLLDGLDKIDWTETAKTAQRNWIGRSEGSLIKFKVKDTKYEIEVFTTRPDTLFGATYMVLSPEHKLISQLNFGNKDEVNKYIAKAKNKSELERIAEQKNKTGIELKGIKAINPANNEEIPIWIADYVLSSYGTGAIMAVPAHDERDNQFAIKFGLPISDAELVDADKITKKVGGKKKITYRLRDWGLSRQRYWGTPIPIVHCEKCGYQPVPEKELPVELPKLDDYKPTDDGSSPLARAKDWVKTKCPKCSDDAQRETDTMDTFVDSSWYFLRYTDTDNKKEFASKDKMEDWMPVDMYTGGAEHDTMHLLYSRFFMKVLHDLGLVDFDEPFTMRRNHGIVLGPDVNKMSKSKGNIVNPDKEVQEYGADTVRMYLAFLGPYDNFQGPWDPKSINGIFRFLNRVWKITQEIKDARENETSNASLHKTIKKVGEDIERLHFNTAISTLMTLLNEMDKEGSSISKQQIETFLQLLTPFAPHITEELWHDALGHKESIHLEPWPEYDKSLIIDETVQIAVQINGRTRSILELPKGSDEQTVIETVKQDSRLTKHLEGNIQKTIYVQDKLLNFVIK